MYTRAAPRNRRSSAFVNRSLLKSKFRCIRMFSVVRQCTLCVLYASTLRSVLSSSELHFAPFGGVSKRVRAHEARNRKSQNQCSKCITSSVELLYLVFSIVSDTHPGARVVGVRAVRELRFACTRRHTHETHVGTWRLGEVFQKCCLRSLYSLRILSNRANLTGRAGLRAGGEAVRGGRARKAPSMLYLRPLQ